MSAGKRRETGGYTLLEITIVMFIMGLAIAGGMRLYLTAHQSQKLMVYKSAMHQNAGYAVRRLVEALEEAGAGLPLDIPLVSVGPGGDSVSIIVNPNGEAYDEITLSEVNDADKSRAKVGSAAAYNSSLPFGYTKSGDSTITSIVFSSFAVDTTCACDSLVFSSALPVNAGDELYVYNYQACSYYRKGSNLYYGIDGSEEVMAENVDSLNVALLDSLETPTTDWGSVSLFRITAKVTTGMPGRYADTVVLSRTVPFQNL